MPLVAPLADAQASDPAKQIFQNLQAKVGMVPNIWRTMGHAPDVLQATLSFDKAILRELDPKLRELAYLKASQLNGCEYWAHYHRAFGRKAGLTDAQINDLANYQQSNAYNDLEKTVLRFAEEWTRQSKASAEVVQKLAQSLTPPQIVVLAATVGLANWTNKFNESFGIQLP